MGSNEEGKNKKKIKIVCAKMCNVEIAMKYSHFDIFQIETIVKIGRLKIFPK